MKIEIGEYARTKDGRIGKLDEIYHAGRGNRFYGEDLDKNYYSIKYNSDEYGRYSDEEIIKHSKNIIDLIEIGDLIKYNSNNSGVDVIEEVLGTCKVDEDYDKGKGFVCTMLDDYIWSNDIKSIVTKEQFNNMEYRV